MDTNEPNLEAKMGAKKLETKPTPRQLLALKRTEDQPAARIEWHSREDFALKGELLTNEEFAEITDAIEHLRRSNSISRNPFED